LKNLFQNSDLSLIALKWILQFKEISCIIPGASKMQQLESNIEVEKMDDLKTEDMAAIKAIYEQYIKADVHLSW
jgi:aryl-alcohol dehydrogenase-like predicted oxidoreductase